MRPHAAGGTQPKHRFSYICLMYIYKSQAKHLVKPPTRYDEPPWGTPTGENDIPHACTHVLLLLSAHSKDTAMLMLSPKGMHVGFEAGLFVLSGTSVPSCLASCSLQSSMHLLAAYASIAVLQAGGGWSSRGGGGGGAAGGYGEVDDVMCMHVHVTCMSHVHGMHVTCGIVWIRDCQQRWH